MTISDACHPGVDYTWPAEFSVMSYIKVSDAPDKATVVSFGSGCFLLKQNASTMRFGTADTYVDATAENLSTGWHLVVAKRSSSGLSIQIDGGTAVTGSTAIEVGGGFQVGTRWTGPNATAVQATNLYIDELAIYNSVLDDTQVAALVEAYPALPKVYTADLSSSTETTVVYSALEWDTGSAPGENAAVVIKTPSAGITITLDSVLPAFSQFTVQGDGKLVFATSAEITGTALSATETVVNTGLDVSAITTSLGTLSVATGKELTVGATTISDIDTAAKGALVVKGVALYDKGDKGSVGLTNGRVITVSGSGASLSLKGNDSTGWGYTDGQKIVLQEGGTLITKSRETMITPLELCGGHLQLTAAQSNRAIDFFNGTASVNDLTVTAKNGETGETLSTLTSTGSDETAQIALIRQAPGDSNNTFSIDVADKARLRVDTILASSATYNNGNGNQTETGTAPLEKKGAGVLELTRVNTYATGTTITGGKVLLTGVGTVGTGTVTIASEATLEIDAATDRDIANVISGSGTVAKRGAGIVALTAVSGTELKVSIQGGTLGIGTLRPAALTIAEGATVLVTPTEEEVTAGSLTLPAGVTAEQILIPGYSISGVSEGTVSFGVVGDVTWTPTADNQAWNDATLWSTDMVPTNGRLTIDFSALTAPATVTIPAGTYFESTTFVGGSSAECALEIEVSSVLALGTVSETSGNVTLPIDVVNAQSAVTVKDGTLTVKTSGDSTLTTALTGSTTNGAFAKSGDGVLTLNAAVRMANKTVVKVGTLKMGTEAITSTGNDGALHDVDVLAGATLDVNGKAALWLQTVTLYEGATYANSGAEIGNTQRQLVSIVLQGNAKVSGANNFGLLASGYGDTALTLNGYTLTKEGAGNFWLYNTTVTGGTTSALAVSAGQFNVQGARTNLASDVALSTTKDSGDALTKNGALTVNTGVMLTVAGRGSMLGGNGSLTVSDGATLKLTSTANISEAGVNYSTITGTGTIHFAGTGFRTLPNAESLRFGTSLAVKNDQAGGLVITQGNTEADPTIVEIGSLSGASPFRADWDPRTDNSRILRIVQSKNTEHTGDLLTSAARLAKVCVAGAADATEKTLTLSGTTDETKPLEIEASGSVNLTGSWAGAVTVAGKLAGTGTVSGTLTFNDGATLDVTNGALTAGTVTIADGATVTVTGAAAAADTVILTCTDPATVAAKLTGAPEGYTFAANEAGTAVVLAAVPTIVIPPVAEGEGSVALSAESQATLLAAAQAAGLSEVTAVSGSTSVAGAAKTLTAAEIDAVLAVFGDSVVTAEGTTLKVDYNFGIVSITPQYSATGELQTFLVKVAVETADGALASIAENVSVKLVDGEDVTIEDGYGLGFQDLDSDGMYEAYFSADPTATHTLIGRSFKVKATK
ncbi:MAG: beta strand repeat-containing protein [Candidatus Spyradenecus sp.]